MLRPEDQQLEFYCTNEDTSGSLSDGCADGTFLHFLPTQVIVHALNNVTVKYLIFPLTNQGQLYVMGGSNGHSDELSCGEMYNPNSDEWTQVPELRTNRCNAGVKKQGAS